MPAEIQSASGTILRSLVESSRTRANAGRGASSSGATAMMPRRRSVDAAATCSASASSAAGATPPRPASSVRFTWSRTSSTCCAPGVAASSAVTRRARSTLCTASASARICRALFVWACPTKCQRTPSSTGSLASSTRLADSSCWRFSAMSRTPSAASSRTSEAGWNFVTTMRVICAGSRSAARAASATRASMAASRSAREGSPPVELVLTPTSGSRGRRGRRRRSPRRSPWRR